MHPVAGGALIVEAVFFPAVPVDIAGNDTNYVIDAVDLAVHAVDISLIFLPVAFVTDTDFFFFFTETIFSNSCCICK